MNEREPSVRRKRRRRRRKSRAKRIIIIVAIAVAVVAAVIGISYGLGKHFANSYLVAEEQQDVDVDMNSEETIAIEIPQGATTRDIASILKENGIIGSELSFRIKSRFSGADGTYNYGTFYLSKNMDTDQIISTLQGASQPSDTMRLTIPEGYTARQIAALVDEMGIVTGDDFINEMNNGVFDYAFLEDVPKRDYYLEGYLFPDTYFLSGNETAHDIISMMLDRFEQVYNEDINDALASTDYTLDQIITIASMVESEAKLDEERPTIAGVIYNRLDIDMPLQIDSTVQYALGEQKARLTYADLKVDSPYNTYQVEGLPAGPICQPHESAIRAALWPEDTDYLFYVLKPDGSGSHNFAVTDEEFGEYREAYISSLE